MSKYYIYVRENGGFNGLISSIHNVEKFKNKKEVSKELFNVFTNKFKDYIEFNPTINKTFKCDFINDDKITFENIQYILDRYIVESTYIEEKSLLTNEQKDIKFLAEFNKSLVEAMPLPSEGQPNHMLQKLQDIIDRYS
ncbi:MAG: hypothetical protein ACRC30_11135 [Clostridium sp.]